MWGTLQPAIRAKLGRSGQNRRNAGKTGAVENI